MGTAARTRSGVTDGTTLAGRVLARRATRLITAVAALSLTVGALAACSDDGPGPTPTGGTVTSSTSGGGGSQSCNMGPVMGSFDDVHGCTVDTAEDHRCEASVTVDGGFIDSKFVYLPKCLLVSQGTTVTVNNADGTNFQIHPLQGGAQGQGADPDSPFGFLADPDMQSADFEMSEAGSFPYICVAHAGSGMVGVVYVE